MAQSVADSVTAKATSARRKLLGMPIGVAMVLLLVALAAVAYGIAALSSEEAVPDADPVRFRNAMSSIGVDQGAALEVASRVCLIADGAEGDYDRAISEIISEFGSSVEVRFVTQNAGFICPAHHELRGAALFRFED